MDNDFDEDDYTEEHNEKSEDFLDRPPVTCPVGERDDCPHFRVDSGSKNLNTDEMEWHCEHPDLKEDEDAEGVGCPLDWDIEDEDEG